VPTSCFQETSWLVRPRHTPYPGNKSLASLSAPSQGGGRTVLQERPKGASSLLAFGAPSFVCCLIWIVEALDCELRTPWLEICGCELLTPHLPRVCNTRASELLSPPCHQPPPRPLPPTSDRSSCSCSWWLVVTGGRSGLVFFLTPELVVGSWLYLFIRFLNPLFETLSTTSRGYILQFVQSASPILFTQGVTPFHFRPFPSGVTGSRLHMHNPPLTPPPPHFFVREG
jgi:hypothetical protein